MYIERFRFLRRHQAGWTAGTWGSLYIDFVHCCFASNLEAGGAYRSWCQDTQEICMVTSKGWGCLRVRVKRGTYALIVDVQLPKKHQHRYVAYSASQPLRCVWQAVRVFYFFNLVVKLAAS